MSIVLNSKTQKKCAFCKYWYDPTNSAITPRNSKLFLWDVDDKAKKKCMKTNLDKLSVSRCLMFEGKGV